MKRIAINGFGRIGKLLLRSLTDEGLINRVVLLNDVVGDSAQYAHLLEFDSIHGRWDGSVSAVEDTLKIGRHQISVSHAEKISALDLEKHRIDLVIDCTGAYRTRKTLRKYFNQGVRKVLVACPVKDKEALNIVYGINHNLYDHKQHNIITAASCTTNALAPIVQVLHDAVGIRHGSITTVHDVTNTQTIVDRPAKDWRRSRSALHNLIPTSTGSATAIALIYPELAGRLDGHAIRVPLLNASLVDCVFELEEPVTVEDINSLFQKASVGKLDGILGFEDRPLVSSDFVNDSRSVIIDAASTMVVNNTQVKVYGWYDNEWGYVRRLCDLARHIAGQPLK